MNWLDRLFGALGFRLVRTPGWVARRRQRRAAIARAEHVVAIARAPGGAPVHAAFARSLLEHDAPFPAYAAARCVQALAPEAAASELVERTRAALPPLTTIGHNRFHRLRALALILERLQLGTGSVLDVGGGDGELAAFLPGNRYFLADKATNGIEAQAVPAELGRFDFVVSCHVLEHVPPPAREAFLDALLDRAERGVVLLNPFQLDGDCERERLELVVRLTGMQWAREHLDCTLPTLEAVRDYARSRALSCEVQPVGALTTAAAYVFLYHYARRAGAAADLALIDRQFNERLCDAELSPHAPTGYAVVLARGRD